MDINFQNILVVTSVILAVIYLFKKFSPKKSTGNCSKKDCGCS